MNTEPAPIQRRNYLDWLRVLTILIVLLFHSARLFDSAGWHVKNATAYFGFDFAVTFVSNWMIPLMFVISGASAFYALRKGGAGRFAKDKVLRLLVPLVVGAVTHVSLQAYLQARTQEGFTGSYWQFLPHYFDGLEFLGGHFPWTGNHLWYLEVLFVFSLALLPLLVWLKWGSGRRVLGRVGDFLARPWAFYLLAVPGAVLIPVLNPEHLFFNGDLWGGWALPLYAFYLLGGFAIASHAGVQEQIRRQRRFSLAAAAVLTVVVVSMILTVGDPDYGTLLYTIGTPLWSTVSWCWVLAILGYGMVHLTADRPALRYANKAVLPFYALHQTVIVAIGYVVVQWPLPVMVKYAVVAAGSFATIMLLYELLIRRVGLLRFLFGMKPRTRVLVAHLEESAPASPREALPSA